MKMKTELFALIFLCLGGKLAVGALSVDYSSADEGQQLERRYAESTIASDISKIMDSMLQKNFVNYLLSQRQKKSEYGLTTMAEDPELNFCKELLKKDFKKGIE